MLTLNKYNNIEIVLTANENIVKAVLDVEPVEYAMHESWLNNEYRKLEIKEREAVRKGDWTTFYIVHDQLKDIVSQLNELNRARHGK